MDNQTNESALWPDELPDDAAQLKERILRQYYLLGLQMVELDDLRRENRRLNHQNKRLRALICPPT